MSAFVMRYELSCRAMHCVYFDVQYSVCGLPLVVIASCVQKAELVGESREHYAKLCTVSDSDRASSCGSPSLREIGSYKSKSPHFYICLHLAHHGAETFASTAY